MLWIKAYDLRRWEYPVLAGMLSPISLISMTNIMGDFYDGFKFVMGLS